MSPKRKRGGDLGGLALRPAPKGREVDGRALAEVQSLLADAPRRPDLLIEHLHRIQDAYGYLSAAHLVALADEMSLTPAEVYEVATFYHHFDVVKPGESPPAPRTVRVCESVSCELAGARALLEGLQTRLGASIRVLPAPCVGRCEFAPVAVVGRNPIAHATIAAVQEAALADHEAPLAGREAALTGHEADLAGRSEPSDPVHVTLADYRAAGGYTVLASCVEGDRSLESVQAAVEASGLRGLGGAGFPTARKWKFVRAEPAPRVVAINADEGEPGTFKDRVCMETEPHRVLEGALIAAWAVDAADVFIYLRDEYAGCRTILEHELTALEADPPCRLPRIHLRRGAGAYICGEETALIESIEGKRGEPRLRPPFPAQAGVFGLPTLVQNVETVYWLPGILRDGADVWASRGRPSHPGVRYFSVSGRVARPGVVLAPNGVSANELIEMAGGMLTGHTFYGYLPGGASGGILPASLGDVPLDFGALDAYGCFIGSAAIVILSDADRARDVARNLLHFFSQESCGKCTPCRVGTAKAVQLMTAERWDLPVLNDLAQVMTDASICGLGQAAMNPVKSVERFFANELEAT